MEHNVFLRGNMILDIEEVSGGTAQVAKSFIFLRENKDPNILDLEKELSEFIFLFFSIYCNN